MFGLLIAVIGVLDDAPDNVVGVFICAMLLCTTAATLAAAFDTVPVAEVVVVLEVGVDAAEAAAVALALLDESLVEPAVAESAVFASAEASGA